MIRLVYLASLFSTVCGLPTATNHSGQPVVDLKYAKYQGVRLEGGVDEFLGMRYASPPIGDLRFRAPRDPSANQTLQSATEVIFWLSVLMSTDTPLILFPVWANLHRGRRGRVAWRNKRRLPVYQCFQAVHSHVSIKATCLALHTGRWLRREFQCQLQWNTGDTTVW